MKFLSGFIYSKNTLKSLSFFILIISSFFSFLKSSENSVFAEESNSKNFSHEVVAHYITNENRDGKLNLSFKTTNKVNNDYLKNFYLNLPFEPKEITIDEEKTPIYVSSVNKIPDSLVWKIKIDILKPTYGENQSFEWGLNFSIKDFVISYGTLNSIILPTFSQLSDLEISYKSELLINKSFGKIASFYNDATLTVEGEYYKLEFEKRDNQSNYLVLLGDEQTYDFKVTLPKENDELLLPLNIPSQKVFFDNFPMEKFDLKDKVNLISTKDSIRKINLTQSLKENLENTSGKIILNDNENKEYIELKEPVNNKKILDLLELPNFDKNKSSINDFVWNSILDLNKKTSLKELFTSSSSEIEFRTAEIDKSFNPLELNKILREHLAIHNIESRGVIGLVNPVNTLDTSSINWGLLPIHTWSEFWNGEKWVSIDPVWIKTSNGNDYFDKNYFHHISFINFSNFNEIRTKIDLIPLLNIRISQEKFLNDIDRPLSLSFFEDTDSTKKLKFIIKNNSKEILWLHSINPRFKNGKEIVKLNSNSISVNKYLLPNSSITGNIQFNHNLLTKDIKTDLIIDVLYEGSQEIVENNQENLSFIHTVNIRNNLPILGMNIYLLIVLLISTLTILLKKRAKNTK